MNWEQFGIILGFLGGWETIKYLINLRWNKRILKVQSKSDEFELLKRTIEFLEQQLNDKEERFAEQTKLLREKNKELVESTNKDVEQAKEIGRLKMELAHYKCWFCRRDYTECKRRDPEQKVKMPYIALESENGTEA